MSGTQKKNPGDEDAPGAPQTAENLCPDCGGTGRMTAIVGDA